MSEMVDRVARAIRDNIQAALPDGLAADYDYAARAAIAAMRDPTTGMVETGKVWAGQPADMEGDPVIDNMFAVERYRAMIDAALGEAAP